MSYGYFKIVVNLRSFIYIFAMVIYFIEVRCHKNNIKIIFTYHAQKIIK